MRPRIEVRRAIVIAALLAPLGLTGCSPAPLPIEAVRAVDGHPVVLIAACAKLDPDRVSVFTEGATPNQRWAVSRDGGSASSEVRLLAVPAGWKLSDASLTEFVAGQNYGVAVHGSGRHTPGVRFTVEQLATLSPDQVIVTADPNEKGKVVSEAKFRAKAKKACR